MSAARPSDFVLSAERMSPVEGPPWSVIEQMISNLGPSSHGFTTLSHKSRGYVQAAGAKLRMIVEYREIFDDGSFHHYVIGKAEMNDKETSISTSAGIIRLRSNEILNANLAVEVFRAFYDGQTVPPEFVL